MKWVFLLGFGGIGLGIFVGGIAWGLKRHALAAHGRRATGRVAELQESTSVSEVNGRKVASVSYYPVVEFQAMDGTTHKFRGSTGSSSPSYEVGSSVELLYMPDNPSNAQIADFSQFWLGPLVLSIFGFVFLAAGIGAFVMIGRSDEIFGPSFDQRINRGSLYESKRGVKVSAIVREIEPAKKWGRTTGLVVICAAPGLDGRERLFRSAPLAVNPGAGLVGRSVDVYVDPYDAERYYIHMDPLLLSTAPASPREGAW